MIKDYKITYKYPSMINEKTLVIHVYKAEAKNRVLRDIKADAKDNGGLHYLTCKRVYRHGLAGYR